MKARVANAVRTLATALALSVSVAGLGHAQLFEGAKLIASTARSDEWFGTSVSVSGDSALVGAFAEDHLGFRSDVGAAFVFLRTAAGWSEQAELIASDGTANDMFGNSVSLSGDTAVVGAWLNDHAAGLAAGAVYVFERSGTSWTERAKLTASDGAPSDHFGSSVSLSGDTLLVGATAADLSGGRTDAGAAYVFVRTAAGWSEQAKLVPSDASTGRQLGASVALSGDTAVINGHSYMHSDSYAGPVYVFVRNGTTWTEQAKPKPDHVPTDYGGSVALDGDTLVVGGPNLTVSSLGPSNEAGQAYVFQRVGTSWIARPRLVASDPVIAGHFGYSVSISGDRLLVGSRDTAPGSAYLFVREGHVWSQRAKLLASDGVAGERFGCSVAISADTAIVGADGEDRGSRSNAGAAYVFCTNDARVSAFHGDGLNADVLSATPAVVGEPWTASVATGHPHGTGGALLVLLRTVALNGPSFTSPIGGRSTELLIGGPLLGRLVGTHDGVLGVLAPQPVPFSACGMPWAAQAVLSGGGFLDLSSAVFGEVGF